MDPRLSLPPAATNTADLKAKLEHVASKLEPIDNIELQAQILIGASTSTELKFEHEPQLADKGVWKPYYLDNLTRAQQKTLDKIKIVQDTMQSIAQSKQLVNDDIARHSRNDAYAALFVLGLWVKMYAMAAAFVESPNRSAYRNGSKKEDLSKFRKSINSALDDLGGLIDALNHVYKNAITILRPALRAEATPDSSLGKQQHKRGRRDSPPTIANTESQSDSESSTPRSKKSVLSCLSFLCCARKTEDTDYFELGGNPGTPSIEIRRISIVK